MKYVTKIGLALGVLAPSFAFAQYSLGGTAPGIKGLIISFGNIINLLIPLAASAALLFFFWGLAQFILKLGKGDEAAVEGGKEIMKWGIIALFVIVSIWGIIAYVRSDLGIPDVQNINAPVIR